jgi:hypothetical protein
VYQAVNQVVDNVTIGDLAARHRQRAGAMDYTI